MSRDEGFILLPLAGQIREGALAEGSTRNLAVLVVVAAHEDRRTRLAWPSLARVATLAGIRKADVPVILRALEEKKWLKPEILSGGKRAWRMLYATYPGDLEPRDWLRLNRSLVMGGTWAAMPESARRLYLVMKALAWVGQKALPDWNPEYEENEPTAWDDVKAQFLPATLFDPNELRRLSGLTGPTFRRARSWLFHCGLAVLTSDDLEPGLLLPHDPGTHAPRIIEQLKRDRAEAATPKGDALRAFRAAQEAQRKNNANKASYRRTLTREPLNDHLCTDERSSGNRRTLTRER